MAIHKGEFDVEILEDLIKQGYQGQLQQKLGSRGR